MAEPARRILPHKNIRLNLTYLEDGEERGLTWTLPEGDVVINQSRDIDSKVLEELRLGKEVNVDAKLSVSIKFDSLVKGL